MRSMSIPRRGCLKPAFHLHEPTAHVFLGASGCNSNNEPQEGGTSTWAR
jgi:hypothetical protein